MSGPAVAFLAIDVSGDAPPAEFRLFAAGWNKTDHGDFLFDASAAADVMARFEAHGVDMMLDLEHLSLSPESPNYDPDARAWFRLEVRADGSLWATKAKWNEDGTERLTKRTQRYVSPAFTYNPKTRRIARLVNVALTALPATFGTPELVAARAPWDAERTRQAAEAETATAKWDRFRRERALKGSRAT